MSMEAFLTRGLLVHFQWVCTQAAEHNETAFSIVPCCTRERKASTMSCHNARSLNQAADNLTKVMECPHYPVNFVQVGYFIQAESLVPYSEKLSREKLLQLLWLFTKVFSTKFESMVSFGTVKASNPRTFSP